MYWRKVRNMRRGKYLAKNTAIFALGNIGTKAISFFMVPLYTQWLVPSDYGVVICNSIAAREEYLLIILRTVWSDNARPA